MPKVAPKPPVVRKKEPNAVDKHIGSRVRMRRLMLGMSQEKLGDALGLTFQQVQKYEKGTNRIGGSRIQQIAGILQVAPAFLFEGAIGGELNPETPSYVMEVLTTTDGLALVKAFSQIERPSVRRSIVGLVRQIVGEADDATT